jgi:D-threo-aldose 1-dehydrogenase
MTLLRATSTNTNETTQAIPHRRLGRTNRQVSQLGLGAAELGDQVYGRSNTVETAMATVQRALELGIDYFDTSPGYGTSEERLGLALASVPRSRYFLATKTGTGDTPHDYSREGTLRSIERSLRRLNTDHLDLVQIHDPENSEFEVAFTQNGALGALQQLKREGVIGAIGIGVRDHDFLRGAVRRQEFDTILTHGDFNLVRQTAREHLFAEAYQTDTAIILGSPVLRGFLTDRPWEQLVEEQNSDGQDFDASQSKRIHDWCAAHNLSVLHLAIQYVLREPRVSVVLAGGRTPEEVEQNVYAATTPLEEAIWSSLEADLGIR